MDKFQKQTDALLSAQGTEPKTKERKRQRSLMRECCRLETWRSSLSAAARSFFPADVHLRPYAVDSVRRFLWFAAASQDHGSREKPPATCAAGVFCLTSNRQSWSPRETVGFLPSLRSNYLPKPFPHCFSVNWPGLQFPLIPLGLVAHGKNSYIRK